MSRLKPNIPLTCKHVFYERNCGACFSNMAYRIGKAITCPSPPPIEECFVEKPPIPSCTCLICQGRRQKADNKSDKRELKLLQAQLAAVDRALFSVSHPDNGRVQTIDKLVHRMYALEGGIRTLHDLKTRLRNQ